MTQHAILGLICETSLHAGAGRSAGGIDLPIQREAHTDWPCVYGSAVKGALRNRADDMLCREVADPDGGKPKRVCAETFYAVFGPDTVNASDHAGALLVGDARLALLPVRSLTSHFKWVACPAILGRLARDAQRLGVTGFEALETIRPPTSAPQGLSPAWSAAGEEALYLEEYRFHAKPLPDKDRIIDALVLLSDRVGFRDDLARQLVVVEDDLFRDLCSHATPVNAHVRLESDTKTVASGALWYEETLPPDSLLYVPLSATRARRPRKTENGEGNAMQASADDILRFATQTLFADRPYLQLGGNETVGMGWCRVTCARPMAITEG